MNAINDGRTKLRETDVSFDAKMKIVSQRDTAQQIAISERGGQVTSSLLPESQAAANQLTRQRDAARGDIARGVLKAVRVELERQRAEATTTARAFLAKHQTLASTEAQLNGFLSDAGQALEPRLTGAQTTNVLEFLARVERAEKAATPRPFRKALADLSFADLLGR
jgi:hypothetical protein